MQIITDGWIKETYQSASSWMRHIVEKGIYIAKEISHRVATFQVVALKAYTARHKTHTETLVMLTKLAGNVSGAGNAVGNA